MFVFLLSVLLLILQPTGGSSQHHRSLIPNVIVVQKELMSTTEVPLVCGTDYEGMDISWRHEGTPLPMGGNRITVTVEATMGGSYTCHDNVGTVLKHQLLLVQLNNTNHNRILKRIGEADDIKCLSKNYSGIFHCSWQWSPDRAGAVVHVSAVRSSGKDNITCSVDEGGSGITCMDQFQCSYAEELDYINLSVYVRYMYHLEEYSKKFSITEIVKPDRIDITKVDGNTFQLEYPKTWSVPESYFPLTFQVKVMPLKKAWDCNHESGRVQESFTRNRTFSVDNQREFRLCVRAQDKLCNSSWSDWNHYEVKRMK